MLNRNQALLVLHSAADIKVVRTHPGDQEMTDTQALGAEPLMVIKANIHDSFQVIKCCIYNVHV